MHEWRAKNYLRKRGRESERTIDNIHGIVDATMHRIILHLFSRVDDLLTMSWMRASDMCPRPVLYGL